MDYTLRQAGLTLCMVVGLNLFSEADAQGWTGAFMPIDKSFAPDLLESYENECNECKANLNWDRTYHPVKPGDNLWKIAKKYYGEVAHLNREGNITKHYPTLLAAANKMSVSAIIKPGQKLWIPSTADYNCVRNCEIAAPDTTSLTYTMGLPF